MSRKRKQAESDEAAGAPEWMVTFSDCMTLLLTFFVLLLSFSTFEEHTFKKLKVIFSNALLPGVSQTAERDKDGLLPPLEQIIPTEDLDEGSEKPTLARGREDNLKEETGTADFHSRKVFVIPSKKVFWGKGAALSFLGRKTLSNIALFLKEVPSRVVISENGPEGKKQSDRFGLS
ncbi:MAG: flagellar motor protein MotB, partial [Planctomycetota bacterium]